MKIVVIGDVSWGEKYHLGDEAMTEVAIQELTRRGASVTLVAGSPEVSSKMYGVSAVPRFGFRERPQRKSKDQHIQQIIEGLSDPQKLPKETIGTVKAVQQADAVLIAGGGNMNSDGIHHLYDRLTLKRIAESLGIPLYVSSQTVGPHLLAPEQKIVKEIVEYARVFGAREESTQRLVSDLTSGKHIPTLTLDDAFLLEPANDEDTKQLIEKLPAKFVVGSFTFHSWSTALTRDQYYSRIARILDDIASETGSEILLLPHMGSLINPDSCESDLEGHAMIKQFSQSGRIKCMSMQSAKQLVAITERAQFTISTRYHPVVFGPNVKTPAIGLVTSYYSAIRMRGSLKNFGMESMAIPFEYWNHGFGSKIINQLNKRHSKFVGHINKHHDSLVTYQRRWWDSIVADIIKPLATFQGDVPRVAPFEWDDELGRRLLSNARASQESINKDRLDRSITDKNVKNQINSLLKRVDSISAKVEEYIAEQKSLNTGIENSSTVLKELRKAKSDIMDKLNSLDSPA